MVIGNLGVLLSYRVSGIGSKSTGFTGIDHCGIEDGQKGCPGGNM